MRLSQDYNGSLENLTIIQPHQIVEAAQAAGQQGHLTLMARYQGWFALVLALAIAAGMFLLHPP